MARLPRLILPGHPHLLRHCCRDETVVRLDDLNAFVYLKALNAAAGEADVKIHAYRVLNSEVRALCTPADAGGLARMMQGVTRRFTAALKARRQDGPLWRGRYGSAVVEQSHVLACMRVVEGAAADWIDDLSSGRSSAGHHLGHLRASAISEHLCYWQLGNTPFEREAAYRKLLEQPLADDLIQKVVQAVDRGWAIGSGEFARGLMEQTGRRMVPLPRGRPKTL